VIEGLRTNRKGSNKKESRSKNIKLGRICSALKTQNKVEEKSREKGRAERALLKSGYLRKKK